MSPGGTYHMQDLDEAGGICAVMKEVSKLGLIHTDAQTITGTVGDRIKDAKILNHEVIHSVEDAYMHKGGIAVLKGNLAPLGSVIKESAVEPDLWSTRARLNAMIRKKLLLPLSSAVKSKKATSSSSATKARKAVRACAKC